MWILKIDLSIWVGLGWISFLVKAYGMYLGMGWSIPLRICGCSMKENSKGFNSLEL